MKRKTLRNMAALLLSFILLLPSPAGTGVFAAENDTADSNTVSLDVSGNSLQDSFLNSTSDTDITVEEPQNTADDTLLIPRTISAFSDEEGNEYDISVTGVLPADATLQVVVLPEEKTAEIVDALPAEMTGETPSAEEEDLIQVTESEGRIAGGIMEGAGSAFLYDITVFSQGKVFQPEDFGEEVTVTIRNVSADKLFHIKAEVADENGNVSEEALQSVAEEIVSGSVETEQLEFVENDGEVTFALSSFSLAGGVNFDTNLYWEITDDKKLIIRPRDGFSAGTLSPRDRSDVYNADLAGKEWPWYSHRANIESIEIRETVVAGTGIRGMFANCTNLTSVDLSGLDLSATKRLNDMFGGCTGLTKVDLGAVKAKPTALDQINRMFKGCDNLTEISFDGFKLSGVSGYDTAFTKANNNNTIESIKVISVKNATLDSNAVNNLFKKHTSLTKADISGSTFTGDAAITGIFPSGLKELNASGITLDTLAISDLTALTQLNLSGSTISALNISSLTNLTYLNASGAELTLASGTAFPTPSDDTVEWERITESGIKRNLTAAAINTEITEANGKLPQGIYRHELGGNLIDRGNIDGQIIWELGEDGRLTIKPANGTSGILSMSDADWPWYIWRSMIKEVKVEGTVTTGPDASLCGMFQDCTPLAAVDLSGLDMSGVINTSGMFAGTALTSFDFNSAAAKPTALKQMSGMFENCGSLETVDLSGLDLSSLSSADGVFNGAGVKTVTAANTTLNQTAANKLFAGYTTITDVDLSRASVTADTKDIKSMFAGTTGLQTLDISGFTNTIDSRLRFDDLPNEITITSGGTTFVALPGMGEWTVTSGEGTVSGLNAKSLRETYIHGNILDAGTYTKTGEGDISIIDNWKELIWEIDNGVLKIYPANGVGAQLPLMDNSVQNGNEAAQLAFWPWDEYRGLITSVEIKQGTVTTADTTNLRRMFQGCTNLQSVDLSSFDASGVTVLNDMFNGCTALTEISLSLNTPNLQQMNRVFMGCSALERASLINTGTSSNISQTKSLFEGCTVLKEVTLSGLDMQNAKNADNNSNLFKDAAPESISLRDSTLSQQIVNTVFRDMTSLKKIDLTGTRTADGSVTTASLLNGVTGLKEIDISGFGNSAANPFTFDTLPVGVTVTSSGTTFVTQPTVGTWTVAAGGTTAEGKTAVDLRDDYITNGQLDAGTYTKTDDEPVLPFGDFGEGLQWDITADGVLRIYPGNGESSTLPVMPAATINGTEEDQLAFWPWNEYRDRIKSVEMNKGTVNTASGTSLNCMLRDCVNLTGTDFTNFDTSNVTSMNDMFNGCSSLTAIPKFNATPALTKAARMFRGCTGLTAFDDTAIDISNVSDMSGFFEGCTGITSVDYSKLITLNLLDASDMFSGCTSLAGVDLRSVDTSSLQNVSGMFMDCTGLSQVNIEGCDLSNVTLADNMFAGASTSIITANRAKLSGAAANNIFRNQASLKSAYLIGASLSQGAADISSMFEGASSLADLDISGFVNNPDARLTFDTLPVGIHINSDGTTYVTPPVTGEWTVEIGNIAEMQLSAENLRNKYISNDGRLARGYYSKTGAGVYSVYGELQNDIVWEIVGDGTLKIYPKNRTSGTLICPAAAGMEASYWPWNAYRDIIRSVEVNNGTVSTNEGASLASMFGGLPNLARADLSGFDISNVKYMNNMFNGCTALKTIALDFQNGASASVQSIDGMFEGCTALTEIDFCDLGTAASGFSYTDFVKGCENLEVIDLSNVGFGNNVTLDLSENLNLKKLVFENANDGKLLNLVLPWEINKAGTWMFNDIRFTEKITLGPAGEGGSGTSGIIEKISEYAPGFEGVGQTYYVIDRLSAYEIQVYDKTMNDGQGGYRVIRNYETDQNGNAVLNEKGEYNVNVSFLPANTEDWMDSDETSFRIRNERRPGGPNQTYDDGHIEIYTITQNASVWTNGATQKNAAGDNIYIYDAYENNPDVIVTIRDAALDVNGNRHDVTVNIDSFTFTNPEGMEKNNYYGSYRRALVGIGEMSDVDTGKPTQRIVFRNYILQNRTQDEAEDYWRYGNVVSGYGTGNHGNAEKASGTWIDASIKVEGGTPDQTTLFFVGDIDHPYDKNNTYGPGSEGIILNSGFDMNTLAISDPTKLKTYDYDKNNTTVQEHDGEGYGNYIVGTERDDATYKSRFYVEAVSTGASFTWTSGLNCDTNILEVSTALDIWQGMPPVSMQLTADKELIVGKEADGSQKKADSFSEGEFRFVIEKNTDISLEDGNMAMNPLAPSGGIGYVNANGLATFPEMVFGISSDRSYIPVGKHYYKIREIDDGTPEMYYDPAEHELIVEILEAETMVASDTIGYTLKAYVDGTEVLKTYSEMTAEYGTAKKAAGGAGSAEFQGKVWKWTDTSENPPVAYEYRYNADTVTNPVTGGTEKDANTWYKYRVGETENGVAEDPNLDATADYTLEYSRASNMAQVNPDGTVTVNEIRSRTWVDANEGTQYKYYPTYGPVALDYSGVMNAIESVHSSGISNEDIRSTVWKDTSVTPNVTYEWKEIPTRIRWTEYADYKNSQVWTDNEGNTYKYQAITDSLTLAEAESRYGGANNYRIRQTVWTDENTGKKYSYDFRTNYQNDPLKGQYDYTDIDANGKTVSYNRRTVYLKDYAIYTKKGTLEELFSRSPEVPAFYRYERLDGEYRYVHYRPSFTVENGVRQYVYDSEGNMLFERYYYSDKRSYVMGPDASSGVTKISLEPLTYDRIFSVASGSPILYGAYTVYDSTDKVNYIVMPPPETATRSRYAAWCSYQNGLSGYSVETEYDTIPKTATGEVSLGRSGWVKYDTAGNVMGEVTAPPLDAFVISGTKHAWIKYTEGSSVGEEVSAPSPASRPADNREVTYTNVWVQEDSAGTYKAIVKEPSGDSTASFTLKYKDASYAVSDGIKTENIRQLTWTDGADSYTYGNGRWLKNGTESVNEPPDTAVAVLWSEDVYRIADSGVDFTNRKWVGLTISKEVAGDGTTGTESFDFTVTFENLKDQMLPALINGSLDNVILDENGSYTFTLRHGGYITFQGLTVGEKYSVRETITDAFTTAADVRGDREIHSNTAPTDGTVTDLSIDHTTVVAYTNTIVPGEITVKKQTLNDVEGEFSFYIRMDNGFVPQVTGHEFKKESEEGLMTTYSFKLKTNDELKIENVTPGVSYNVWEVLPDDGEWKLENIDGKKITEVENTVAAGKGETHTFYNRFRSSDISITKKTVADKDGSFKFRITFDKGNSSKEFTPGAFNLLEENVMPSSYSFVSPEPGYAIYTSYTDKKNYITYEITETSAVRSERKNGVITTTTLAETGIRINTETGEASFAADGMQYAFSQKTGNDVCTLSIYQYKNLSRVTDAPGNTWEFELGSSQTMKIMGVPKGASYTLWEVLNGGWTLVDVKHRSTAEESGTGTGTTTEWAAVSTTDTGGQTGTVTGVIDQEKMIYEYEYTNLGPPVDLTIKKTVTGNIGDRTKPFSFTLTISSLANQTVKDGEGNDIKDNSGNAVQFDEYGIFNFTLKHGESLTLPGLRSGTAYSVKENTGILDSGYTTTLDGEAETATDNMLLLDTTTHTFVNEKNGLIPTGINSTVQPYWLLMLLAPAAGLISSVTVRLARRRKKRYSEI